MVPNSHESTYFFFRVLIDLGLFRPKIGLIKNIDLFLYHWDPDVKKKKKRKR